MKKYLFVIAILAATPLVGFAAYNDVSLDSSTILSVGGASLTVVGNQDVLQSITVSDTNFSVTLVKNSELTVQSSSRYVLAYSVSGSGTNYALTRTCTASLSSIQISSADDTSITVTVTPNTSTTCSVSTGAGGGGSYTYIPPTVPADVTTPPAVAQTPNTSGLSQSQIDAIISLLQSFSAEQSVIDKVRASLSGNVPSSVPMGTLVSAFTRGLSQGKTGEDVKSLQKALNANADTRIASSGVGSPGHETMYFGAATKAAVQKFQLKYGIAQEGDSGFGVVGPKTRAKLNELFGT